jgi:hypothetical protein
VSALDGPPAFADELAAAIATAVNQTVVANLTVTSR